ncbi:methylated-DNA--[protein]-cysteine S-methyltransferase [Heliobacterium gestii]|uniref:Methylated-DNA--protein-cysteine methyltransferase n=1 Tax=Heliomicrobium gestii TaxID=2699 RepID=A0A845LAI8_HELGE|nr:methylated-DNA--[protein]-cysteine S-methyltransferase [Heliomicrobium gestii]MBM7866491.1 methylated-DNA-[protein]-cysteine S-methyltransferase [Heliomicrobium gestii]MZP43228.1 methylated-DNA--[protein]-cysteine S-methyltransferase [Heliomicrobium gestii]
MPEVCQIEYQSAIGLIEIGGTDQGIESICFVEDRGNDARQARPDPPACLVDCLRQLDEYFQGARQTFSLTMAPRGTAFQQRVWQALAAIPFGETRSYRQIAETIGNPRAVRAVGGANHNNPLSIIVPCHRVIGSDGSLTGYGGGLWRKEWLLNHEKGILR